MRARAARAFLLSITGGLNQECERIILEIIVWSAGFSRRDSILFERRICSMDYGMIGKIDKAKKYAEQRDRIRIENLDVTFIGQNNDHVVSFSDGKWQCDCDFFQTRGRCSHTMALEIILEDMLVEQVQEG
jgi:hypothetical protein